MESNYRIEFDVWGTFTDRVLVSGENVLAKARDFKMSRGCQGDGSFDNIIPKK